MLETTRSTPRQGILVHRLEKMLTGLEEDFIPDPTTLERYASRIGELEKAYIDTADRIYRKEMEELSPYSLRSPNQALPCDAFTVAT
jgi:hypothetical protein